MATQTQTLRKPGFQPARRHDYLYGQLFKLQNVVEYAILPKKTKQQKNTTKQPHNDILLTFKHVQDFVLYDQG